jgi:GNAT superfamily N-acetyltransferase
MVAEGLTTGWEADVGADDSLLRGFVLSTADRSVVLAEAGGGAVRRTDRALFADARSPVLFDNAVTLLHPLTAEEARDVAAEALDFFPVDRPFVLLSVWPIPGAGDLGLELMGHPPFMFRPAGPPPDGWDRGLELREVDDAEGLATFFRTITEAYPMPADDSALAHEGVLGTDIRLWVGYEGDRPVGTAGTYVAHGTNDVEWVSVYPEHRGKGYGAALTWAATLADPTLPGVLIASDDGQPVYERMGYVRLTRLSLWFRPPS